VAAWPAVALVGSYELLMTVIRSSQAGPDGASRSAGIPDPLQEQAAEVSLVIWRRTAFPRSGRSALSSTSASPGRNGCGTTLLQEPRGRLRIPLREQLAGRSSSYRRRLKVRLKRK
jgi:hypothetical protein